MAIFNKFSVQLVREKGKRYDMEKIVRSPEDAVDIINEVMDFQNLPNEHFVIFTLSTKNEVIGIHTVHVGSVNASIVHPREVFQRAILNNASSIILFHNHPSGNPSPSQEDIQVTRRLVEGGKMLGIDVLDHLIVGYGKFVSLKEKGYL